MRSIVLAWLALACVIPLARAATNPNAVAVIIGNKSYARRGVPGVEYADRDAGAMRLYAVQLLGFDPENVIAVTDAGLGEMNALFGSAGAPRGRLARLVGPVENAGAVDVFVFYAGHGFPGLDDHKGYLLPIDADPRAPEATGYGLDLLVANLQKLGARSVLLVIDACFSGEASGGKALLPHASVMVRAADPVKPATRMTILTASGPTQPANWDVPARHGLLTEFYLRAVYGEADDPAYGGRRDGRVTARMVKRYLDRQMTRWAARELDSEQDASLSGDDAAVLAAFAPGHPPARPPEAAAAAPVLAPEAKPETPDRESLIKQADALIAEGRVNEGLEIYLHLAERGDPLGTKLLGSLYDDGRGVPRSDAEAMRWYRQAADLGDSGAMNNVGTMYESGQGVARDFPEAARWYRRAADLGNAHAMSNLGALYGMGHGVARDLAEAMRWFRKAADGGDKAALNNIAAMYDNGVGVARDHGEALRWYHQAAEGGDTFAMGKIGAHYEAGRGVARDLDEARHWYRRAADAGNGAAAQALARLGR